MKTLVVSLVLIVVAIAAAFFIHNDPGQVTVVFQGKLYETTLGLFLAGLAVAFIALYILVRILSGLMNAPKSMRKRGALNRERKAHESLGSGLVKLNEGDFESAENTMLHNLSENATCDAATYITAARSASERRQYDVSADYLKKAVECSPESEVAAGIAEGEMLLKRHEFRDAVKALSAVRNKAPNNARAMWLLAQAHKETHNWESMADVLKSARKRQAAPKEELLRMERAAAVGALSDAAEGNVQDIFERQPQHIQESADVLSVYAKRLNDMSKGDDAAKLIVKALNKDWSEDLAAVYGTLTTSDVSAQLDQAEKWHKENGDSMSLLLSLGNLSYQRNLWGKAKDYIVKSIGISPSQQGFFALGKTLEAMDDANGALEAYKHGYAMNEEIVTPSSAKPVTLENPAKIPSTPEAAPA